MSQTDTLIKTLKRELRRRGKTYASVAQALALSESSVKRLLSSNDISLSRLESICHSIGMTVAELVEIANQSVSPLTQFTPEQEQELARNLKLLLVTYLVLNRWQFDEIVDSYNINTHELIKLLAHLERLKMIELLPMNRIRLLTSRNFSWRKNGPINRIFVEQIQKDFFNSDFERDKELMIFLGGALSENSIKTIKERISELATEVDAFIEKDQKLPRAQKMSTGAIFAIRPIEFSIFRTYKRK